MSRLALNRGLTAYPPASPSFGVVDKSFTVRRLFKNTASLLAAHPRAQYLGPDVAVENIAVTHGFASYDLAILRISLSRIRRTLVCVPEPVWHLRAKDLLKLKHDASRAGRKCVLVPEKAVQRQPRLDNARAIEMATGIDVSMEDRLAILLHLAERGSSTLFDCACAISHPSPFSAVLHLAALGVIAMGTDRPLSPETRVDLPDIAIVGA